MIAYQIRDPGIQDAIEVENHTLETINMFIKYYKNNNQAQENYHNESYLSVFGHIKT